MLKKSTLSNCRYAAILNSLDTDLFRLQLYIIMDFSICFHENKKKMLILGMCQNGWRPSSKVLLPLLEWHFRAMKVRLFIYSLELKRTVLCGRIQNAVSVAERQTCSNAAIAFHSAAITA